MTYRVLPTVRLPGVAPERIRRSSACETRRGGGGD